MKREWLLAKDAEQGFQGWQFAGLSRCSRTMGSDWQESTGEGPAAAASEQGEVGVQEGPGAHRESLGVVCPTEAWGGAGQLSFYCPK